MIRLTIQSPDLPSRVVVLDQPLVAVGRNARADVVLTGDDRVSWNHMVIEKRTEGYVVRDLGSLNRTVVNKQEIDEHRLRTGDVIEVGAHRIEFQDMQPLLPPKRPAADGAAVPRWVAWAGPVVLILFLLQVLLLVAQVAAWMPGPGEVPEPVPLPEDREAVDLVALEANLRDLRSRVTVTEGRLDAWEAGGRAGPDDLHRRLDGLEEEVRAIRARLGQQGASHPDDEP